MWRRSRGVAAEDLQKYLELARISEENIVLYIEFLKRPPGCFRNTFETMSCGWVRQRLNIAAKLHNTKTSFQLWSRGGGIFRVWGCFAAAGPGRLSTYWGNKESKTVQRMFAVVRLKVCHLELKTSWMVQENNLAHNRLAWKEENVCFGMAKSECVCVWSLIQQRCCVTTRAGLLMQEVPEILMDWSNYRDEWWKIPPHCCESASLMSRDRKCVEEDIAAKGGPTRY